MKNLGNLILLLALPLGVVIGLLDRAATAILPHWYLTWWALTLTAVGLGAALRAANDMGELWQGAVGLGVFLLAPAVLGLAFEQYPVSEALSNFYGAVYMLAPLLVAMALKLVQKFPAHGAGAVSSIAPLDAGNAADAVIRRAARR